MRVLASQIQVLHALHRFFIRITNRATARPTLPITTTTYKGAAVRSRVIGSLLVLLVLATSSFAQRRRATGPRPPNGGTTAAPLGSPLPGLTAAQRQAFDEGRAEFTEQEEVMDGLGPIFNGRSCVECHSAGAPGGAGRRTVTRFGAIVNGVFDPLAQLGGSLLQERAIGPREGSPRAFTREIVPAAATVTARRRTPALFGLGLVDATPDATFIALAQQQATRNDGTAGRAALVQNILAGMRTVGKFGWKSQVPTLFQFSGDAYLNEMGITSPHFPNENCANGNCAELAFNPAAGLNDNGDDVQSLVDFMIMLAPPSRGPITADVTEGERVFAQIGCNSCHVATLQSGASNIAALNRQTYHPYSDFLLHDMGSLGDGIAQGDAARREIRTAPLWGLRHVPTYLHDGRANSVEQAIQAHDGQGRASRERFSRLDGAARARLMAFLMSL